MRLPGFVLFLMFASPLAAQTSPVVVVEKPEFRALVAADAALEAVATGFRFTEGTTWNPQDNTLIFSDIPADRLYCFRPTEMPASAPRVFREPSNHANGNTFDADGNLYTCEHGSRTVTMTKAKPKKPLTHDVAKFPLTITKLPAQDGGKTVTLADRFEGKLLNSPNDIVVKSDGSVWFTDPTYGLEKRPAEQSAKHVFCLDPKTGNLRTVADDFDQPNGLCFSPDEKKLYIADSGKPHYVRVFGVTADNTLADGRVFCVIDPGVPDGMRCDRAGNLWSTAGDGVHVFNPAGERIGKILVPQTPANLCFGGPSGNDLYIAARTTIYRIKTLTNAAAPAASK